jgi:GTP-binding protein Era
MASEFIREQTFLALGQELPYSIAVEISKYQEGDNGVLNIDAVIWVEKTGQKSIVIGKKGHQLKLLGTRARVQMEKAFDQKVFLNLWVKVKKGWGDQENLLRSLGYSED